MLEPEPPYAAGFFGDRIELARQFTADLAEHGEERGLIGPLELERLWSRHVVNSALLAPLLVSGRVGDVGSGAGLPGLVLAIARPDAHLVLIEPMERRTDWLTEESDRLGLDNVTVMRGRAEDIVPDPLLDQVTARAVSALGKLVPPEWRMLAFGAGTAAGSFGQFLFSTMAIILIDQVGWQGALTTFGCLVLLVLPLSLALATPRADDKAAAGPVGDQQSAKQALAEAFGHRSYVLLVLGFFTCGFQIAFITVHLPSYLIDRGLSADAGAWTIGVIGLFNILGSLTAGWLGNRMPKRYILAFIYFTRALAVIAFITLPMTFASAIIFGAVTGFLWLSTVPPTSSLVAVMFGTRWLAMLFGFAFFSHQVGGFLGVWLGGLLFEQTGSYDIVWWLSVCFGIASALINLPIVERPVERSAVAAT